MLALVFRCCRYRGDPARILPSHSSTCVVLPVWVQRTGCSGVSRWSALAARCCVAAGMPFRALPLNASKLDSRLQLPGRCVSDRLALLLSLLLSGCCEVLMLLPPLPPGLLCRFGIAH